MREIFHIGGFGMYPTAIFGLLLIGVAIRYAIKPEARFIPLQITLGLLTFFAGCLGFVTGVITSFSHLMEIQGDGNAKWIPLIGTAESLYNVALALALIIMAVLAASVGAARIASGLPREASAKA